MNEMTPQRREQESLGSTTDIGAKLRALYGSVQEEGIPQNLLDLLERLDDAEHTGSSASSERK